MKAMTEAGANETQVLIRYTFIGTGATIGLVGCLMTLANIIV